jgi:hypothetical protein
VSHIEERLGTSINAVIGENLHRLRTHEWEESEDPSKKVSQDDIAWALSHRTGDDWRQQYVSSAEKGERPFRVAELFVLAELFEVSLIRLLQPNKPTKAPISIGTMTVSPDELLTRFVMDPRPDDPDAKRFGMRDPFPMTYGAPLKSRIDMTRAFSEAFQLKEDGDIEGALRRIDEMPWDHQISREIVGVSRKDFDDGQH